ncbi:MAG: formate acetyltransferase, partial [bacterium]|nr:formate acetyltransferase [bacterium]
MNIKKPSNQKTRPLSLLNTITNMALKLMAAQFNHRASLRQYMKGTDGWINFTVGLRTETGSVEQAIIFNNGRVSVLKYIPENADVVLRPVNDNVMKEAAKITPNEMLNLLLKNKLILDGNLAYMQLFNFYVSLLLGKKHQRMLNKNHRNDIKKRKKEYDSCSPGLSENLRKRKEYRMKGRSGENKGVKHLSDPYLPDYSIDDFPRLNDFLNTHFTKKPEICAERPKLLTDWFRENGWDKDKNGNTWFPELRNAFAFKHLMQNKKPVIRKNDLMAGTTTSKEVGVTVFPDGQGTMFWSELYSVEQRVLNPYICTKKTADTLHYDVFPYWTDKTFREYARIEHDYPQCLKIDERWVAYYVWKTTGISHTIPNFKRLCEKGINGIINDINNRKQDTSLNKEDVDTLESMKICLEGAALYASNLSTEARRAGAEETNAVRKKELERLSEICSTVPVNPAKSLDEALNSIWISWVA